VTTDYWIKLYIEILDDPKMATLPDRTWRRVVELFLLAGRLSYKTGQLPDTKQIAWSLRISEDEANKDLEAIEKIGIIQKSNGGWIVVNFEDRQDAATSTERWQAHRDRKRKEEYYQREANDIQTKSLTDTESDTDTESESSAKTAPPLPRAVKPIPITEPIKAKPIPKENPNYAMAQALSEVTGMNLRANEGRIFKNAKELLKVTGIMPEDIRRDYGEGGDWYRCDWRGKQGEKPTPEMVRATLGNLNRNGKGNRQPLIEKQTPEQIKEIAELLRKGKENQ
jgi:hypothetical protein